MLQWDRGSTVVEVLCYKSEGRWFNSRWCHWNFSLTQNSSDRTMALGSTQPLTEMSTSSISWGGKGGQYIRLTTLPPSCAFVMKSGNLNFLEPSGPPQTCNGTALPLPDKLNWICDKDKVSKGVVGDIHLVQLPRFPVLCSEDSFQTT